MKPMLTSKKHFRRAAPSCNRQQAANIEQPAASEQPASNQLAAELAASQRGQPVVRSYKSAVTI